MSKIRIIVSTDGNGKNEYVLFTKSFDDPAEEFIQPGGEVVSDQIIEWEEPSSFPLESVLQNIG